MGSVERLKDLKFAWRQFVWISFPQISIEDWPCWMKIIKRILFVYRKESLFLKPIHKHSCLSTFPDIIDPVKSDEKSFFSYSHKCLPPRRVYLGSFYHTPHQKKSPTSSLMGAVIIKITLNPKLLPCL